MLQIHADDEVWRYLVYLKYWTLKLKPPNTKVLQGLPHGRKKQVRGRRLAAHLHAHPQRLRHIRVRLRGGRAPSSAGRESCGKCARFAAQEETKYGRYRPLLQAAYPRHPDNEVRKHLVYHKY